MEFKELVSKLKQSNISADGEKTKSRVRQIWQSAGKPDREAILVLAGVKPVTLRRAYLTGSISAKLALPLALKMNVDPYYLIGRTDEPGAYSEALMIELLRDLKYNKLAAEAGFGGTVKKRTRRNPPKKKAPEPVLDVAPAAEAAPPTPEQAVSAPVSAVFTYELTEDEAILLLKAALLKARAGGDQAEKARQIKALLLD